MVSQPIRIKSRTTGAAGAPSTLKTGELAINHVDEKLYVGLGNDGEGNATSIKMLASTATADGFGYLTEAEADALYDAIGSAAAVQAASQPLDATLTALASYSTNGLLTQTAADTFTGRTITGTANQISVANGDGVAGNPTLSLPADVLIPTVLTAPNTGLHLLDTDASHDLIIKPGSNLTADHTLTITTGDADRTLDISAASVTVSAYMAGLLDDADEATFKASVNLEPGVDVQAYDADLASWAGVTRAAGFDTFAATPSSANLASLVTGETGSGALVFGTSPTLASPTITTSPTAAGATWTDLGAVTTVDINGGTIDGVTIGGASAGAITGTTITANTGVMPDANDGAYLGQSGTAFSDLFLASGAVINFNAGDVTITHSADQLSIAGLATALDLYLGPTTGYSGVNFYPSDYGSGKPSMTLQQAGAAGAWQISMWDGASYTTGSITAHAALVMGTATGGAKGYGTINAAAVYDDNTLLTDYVFDLALDGALSAADAENARAQAFDPALLDIDTFAARCRERRALPAMPLRAEWTDDTRLSVGELTQRLWETVETMAVHIDRLNERIKMLEASQ